MENKYYTPTIDEFYVGFEFESNYILFREGNKSEEWTKHILSLENHGWFWESYYNDAVEAEFRVKHLDKEDIESLGFIEDDNGFSNEYTFKSKDFKIKLPQYSYPDHIHLTHDYFMHTIWIGELGHELFNGVIKNKSELKKLLKQLNIN